MELFSAEQLQYLDSLFVKKNNEILITQSTVTTKLGFIEKLGGATLLAAIGALVAQICEAIFK